MVDGAHLDGGSGSMTVTQSRTSWGIEVGRHRFSVTRTREARTIGGMDTRPRPRAAVRPAWPLAIGAFASVSAFGLFVVGAIASEPSVMRAPPRYSLSLPVPVRAAKVAKAPSRNANRSRAIPAPRQAPAWLDDLSGPRFDLADEPYVIRAMQLGELQEWTGPDGQRRFLNAGPEQAEGDRRCRDLALLVRHPDGSSRTRTARRCAPQPSERAIVATAKAVSPASDLTDAPSLDLDELAAGNATYADGGDGERGIASAR